MLVIELYVTFRALYSRLRSVMRFNRGRIRAIRFPGFLEMQTSNPAVRSKRKRLREQKFLSEKTAED